MAFKTFVNGTNLPASDVNDYLMKQSVMVFADSAARASALTVPTKGMTTYLQDVSHMETYNGSSWVREVTFGDEASGSAAGIVSTGTQTFAGTKTFSGNISAANIPTGTWTAYTPSLSNTSIGNGALAAAYTKIGKTVFVRIFYQGGSTTSYSGTPCFSLPSTVGSYQPMNFQGFMNSGYQLMPLQSSNTVAAYVTRVDGTIATYANPYGLVTMGNGTQWFITGFYEEA